MPELPEVETQVRDLQILVGHKILDLSTDTPKAFRPSFAQFRRRIRGQKILAIERRAKFLIFTLGSELNHNHAFDSNLTHHLGGGLKGARQNFGGGLTDAGKNLKMVVHFRMTGHFLLAKNFTPLEKAVRHFFQLSGGIVLQFSDIRKFGTLELLEKNAISTSLAKLGAEPLDPAFTLKKFRVIFQNKKGNLKAFLLDQKNIVGIGNIYADEICFAARLHPASEIQNLSDQDFKNLYREIRKQLKKGIKNRGTTIGEYVDTAGEHGSNQHSLMAYKKHGQPCQICGTTMQKIKIVQRTTSFCPCCQVKK